MTSFSFPEYDAQSGLPARLHAVVRVADRTAAESLCGGLGKIFEEASVHERAGQFLLSLLGGPEQDATELLCGLQDAITAFNRMIEDGFPAEIVETRLVAASGGESSPLIKIGGNIYAATDEQAAAEADRPCLLLDAGLAFGTGTHPSTRLSVMALEDLAGRGEPFPAIVLDVGAGSGILAMVCAVLGASRVRGIDISAEAVAVAEENIRRNGLTGKVTVDDTPFDAISQCYELIVANLTPSVLRGLAEGFGERLAPQGFLIISGFQGRQADDLRELFEGKGFSTLHTYTQGRWHALVFKNIE